MKTQSLDATQCLICGGKLNRVKSGELYECIDCGEVFDLRDISKMEIDLDVLDRLLIYSLKRKTQKTIRANSHS